MAIPYRTFSMVGSKIIQDPPCFIYPTVKLARSAHPQGLHLDLSIIGSLIVSVELNQWDRDVFSFELDISSTEQSRNLNGQKLAKVGMTIHTKLDPEQSPDEACEKFRWIWKLALLKSLQKKSSLDFFNGLNVDKCARLISDLVDKFFKDHGDQLWLEQEYKKDTWVAWLANPTF